jgi:hypothetical protein
MDYKEINIKLDKIVEAINREIDGKCYAYMSRFNCEWYYHIPVQFEFSNLHVDLNISEETMITTPTRVLIHHCINCIKAEIISHYFK